jgi:hypothetical protein
MTSGVILFLSAPVKPEFIGLPTFRLYSIKLSKAFNDEVDSFRYPYIVTVSGDRAKPAHRSSISAPLT